MSWEGEPSWPRGLEAEAGDAGEGILVLIWGGLDHHIFPTVYLWISHPEWDWSSHNTLLIPATCCSSPALSNISQSPPPPHLNYLQWSVIDTQTTLQLEIPPSGKYEIIHIFLADFSWSELVMKWLSMLSPFYAGDPALPLNVCISSCLSYIEHSPGLFMFILEAKCVYKIS